MTSIARGAFAALTLAAFGSLAPHPATAETVKMTASLKGQTEVPANTTPGTGQVTATYDTASHVLDWEGTYSGLTGTATMAHFHGPAEPGKNAPVMVPSPAATPIKGTATLTDSQEKALLSGQTYFNVHTAANPGGEIRGQVVR